MPFFKKLREKYRDMPKGAFFLVIACLSALLVRDKLEFAARIGRMEDWIIGVLVVIVAVERPLQQIRKVKS